MNRKNEGRSLQASLNIHVFSEIGRLKEENVLVLPLDIVNFDDHKAAVNHVLSQFKRVGTGNVLLYLTKINTRYFLCIIYSHFLKIDILVNNAGRSSKGSALKTAIDVDRQIYEVNVLGTISLTRHILPTMIKRKQGHIVVTSSLAGKIGKIDPFYF